MQIKQQNRRKENICTQETEVSVYGRWWVRSPTGSNQKPFVVAASLKQQSADRHNNSLRIDITTVCG
jgi:hypothetical protein